MSFDRKNKRAAQAALREAQALEPPLSPHSQQQRNLVSGIGKSLKNSAETGVQDVRKSPMLTEGPRSNGTTSSGQSPNRTAARAPNSPSPVLQPRPIGSPPIQNANLHHTPSYAHPGPSYNSLAPSGLSQSLNPQFPAKGSSSVAAQVMLGQHGRRLSNNGNSLSPTRQASRRPPGYSAAELYEATPNISSSPLALPSASVSGIGSSGGIFGTSPFSGSRALFMPSSYDSSDGDGFPRSPPTREFSDRRNTNSGWDRPMMPGYEVEEEAVGEESDDEYEEGFLPSSLNDLLTPDEQRRRASKMNTFDPFKGRSVPAELILGRGRPLLSATEFGNASGTNASPVMAPRSLLSSTSHTFTASSPPATTRDFLSSSPQHSALHAQRLYSASYDPSSFSRPANTSSSSNFFSPSLEPGSLPGGLAAGLSNMHLQPASYTGNTPPSVSFFGPSPTNSLSDPATRRAWNGTPLSWGASSVGSEAKAGVGTANVPKKSGPGSNGGVGPPLHPSGLRNEDDDEIQFDMDA